jgi:hypothetical protein
VEAARSRPLRPAAKPSCAGRPLLLREERIEQPGSLRLGRMIGSALRQSEETLTVKVSSRLDDEVTAPDVVDDRSRRR